METYLILWIFTFGLLLHLQFVASNTTVTDSSILNLIVENSTDTNFDKQLKTNYHDSNDSFSSNSVNIGPVHSSHINEECKNGDCANVYSSVSMDNSSTASKILWNLVSTVKSTTNQQSVSDEINDEGITIFPLNNSVNTHSSDNELDSKINFENDMLNVAHSSEVINNSSSIHPYLDFNFPTTTSESVVETMKNEADNIDLLVENLVWESTEMYSETVTSDSIILDAMNVTEYTTTSNIPETTVYGADEDSDFTSDVLNLFETNVTEFVNKLNASAYVFKNLTTEMPYSEIDDSLNYEYNESSTLFSVNNDFTPESETLNLKYIELGNVTNSESYTASYEESSVSSNTENENNSLVSLTYDVSLDSEELKSKDDILNTTNLSKNISISHSTIAPIVETLVDGHLWFMSDEFFNSTFSDTVSNTDSSIDIELPKNESDPDSVFMASENHNTSSESDLDLLKTLGNRSSTFSMTTGTSTKTVEVTDHASYLPQETQMSTSHIGLFYTTQNFSNMLNDSSDQDTNSYLQNEATTNGSLESTEMTYFNLKTSNEVVPTAAQDLSTTTLVHSDDSTESSLDRTHTIVSHSPILDYGESNVTYFVSSMETDFTGRKKILTSNEEPLSSSPMPNTDPNINVVHVNDMHVSSTQSSHQLNDLNKVDNSSLSVHTNPAMVYSNPRLEASTVFSVFTEPSPTEYTLKANSHDAEISATTQESDKISISTYSNIETKVTTTSDIPNENLTPEHFEDELNNSSQNIDPVPISTEKSESDLHTTDINYRLITHTEQTPSEILTENIGNTVQIEMTKTFSSTMAESDLSSEGISVDSDNMETSNSKNFNSTTKHFDTIPISRTHEIEVNTSPASVEISSLGITETHREGKHIPFSSTLVKSTTEYPRIFNVTIKTFSQLPEHETTENNFVNLLYNQIKAEELSPEERSNLINAVVKLPDNSYSKETLNEKIAIIHLWLLHAIADEYKNATLNLSGSTDGQLDEIEFENLPQILYVLPTPEIYLPNISFTFVVHNKWRNETFPVDLILTILNLHTEDLKHLVEIEEIHFSHGLLVQEHDLLSVIIEKYGIILLSTCFITVAMILLLICVVIYYRRKTRHSAHCLTDDKLHRNMQEAMGIDLNPAVVILQDEIREKAALNGNKICNLDDDEGWLAPIGDVPVEDNNAPFVQDTKL